MNAAKRITPLLIGLASLACDSGTLNPIAFPMRAYAGETVSFAISSDSPTGASVNHEL